MHLGVRCRPGPCRSGVQIHHPPSTGLLQDVSSVSFATARTHPIDAQEHRFVRAGPQPAPAGADRLRPRSLAGHGAAAHDRLRGARPGGRLHQDLLRLHERDGRAHQGRAMGEAFVTRFDGPGPEGSIVKDMAKRAAIGAPVLIIAFGLIWGVGGALSTAYAIALVMLNFALSAAILSWSARISLGMLMGATLFGFLIRMAIVLVAVLAVVHTSWVEVVPLGITIVVTHLGLLFW